MCAGASPPPFLRLCYCNSNCTGVMEHRTRLLSAGWSTDYSSRIQSELNACPQFILRVMLSAAPVYGYVRRKSHRRTCERIHFSPYCREKSYETGSGWDEVYFDGKTRRSLTTPAGELITWLTCFWCSIWWPSTIPGPQSHRSHSALVQ